MDSGGPCGLRFFVGGGKERDKRRLAYGTGVPVAAGSGPSVGRGVSVNNPAW